ncbi:MAG TPA: hypothetical protein VN033_13475 [Vulgatibacter sp.]|nr:hypothetical protein [Vulgatibacter sp.]
MRAFHSKMLGLLALVVLTLTVGCTKRTILRFEDHPIQNQTYVETLRHSNYLVSSTMAHEFWLCRDDATELVCKPTCDGDTDLACPAVGGSISITSNFR